MVAYYTTKVPLAYQGITNSIQFINEVQEGVVIHDLYLQSVNTQMGFWEKYQENRWLKKVMKEDTAVFVFTSYTKIQLEKAFAGSKAVIHLLPPSFDEVLIPTDEDARDVMRYQYTQGDAFFLCAAPIHESANIIPLLKGYSQFKKRTGSNMKLVLTGVTGPFSSSIISAVETYKYRNDLVFLQGLTASDKRQLLCAAYALVHPCRWERFGMPVLDAMKAGVAVLTAEDSSMSEMAGMAGMFFNEKEGGEIGEKMIRVYNDEQMKNEMIGTGLSRFR